MKAKLDNSSVSKDGFSSYNINTLSVINITLFYKGYNYGVQYLENTFKLTLFKAFTRDNIIIFMHI